MTWPNLEHERRVFNVDAPYETAQEATLMQNGWLLKVRFPDRAGQNVTWFFVPIGNCTVCQFYVPGDREQRPRCTNPDPAISSRMPEYVNDIDCPGWSAGVHQGSLRDRDMLDAMVAAGLLHSGQSQPVEVLQKLRWTPWRAHQAHAQQAEFLARARDLDAGIQPRQIGDTGDIEE